MRTISRAALSRLAPFCLLALVALSGCAKKAQRPASALTDEDRAALASYEKVRAALADDDLRGAKKAAGAMADSLKPASPTEKPDDMYAAAQTIAESPALDRAREDFKSLSAAAIRRGGDVAGYYVLTCPMTSGGDWLQTDAEVKNPYLGKVMHDCGGIKK